jgi:hypothetical protein
MSWLIHELTHTWQYQQIGFKYLLHTIWVHFRQGQDCYNYGWEQGLINAREQGKGLIDFNLEQQGEIARHYYLSLKQDQKNSVWESFVREIQAT